MRTLDGEAEYILVHTEVQAQRDTTLGMRMLVYNLLLRLRSGQPTRSVAAVLYPNTDGISRERYTMTVLGEETLSLQYRQIGLRDLPAAEYINAEPDLAAALAALMRPGPDGRAALKLALIRRLMRSTLDEARVFLLANIVETFMKLDMAEQMALNELLRGEGGTEVETTELTWADQMMARGFERGTIAAKRQMVVRQLSKRFGSLPASVEEGIAAADETLLDRLADAVITAGSIAEIEAMLAR